MMKDSDPLMKDDAACLDVPGEAINAVCGMRAPIMISHVVPDADALGAMLAMARAWSGDDVKPRVSLPAESLSQKLAFLADWAKTPAATPDDFAQADGFVVLDTAEPGRCNLGKAVKETDWQADRPLVNIDHHETNTCFGSVNWVVRQASSTCELVYYLLRSADRPIDAVTASLLYAGIQTDTLGFSLRAAASALQAAADLVAYGADVAELGHRLYRSQRQSEFDLLRVIYANTTVLLDGQLVYSFAGYDDIHNAGCSAADIDDQIGVPRSLNGARLAILFTEGNRGRTRINFRGSGEVTVVELAARFKGGGHSQAAGAILDCPLEKAVQQVVPQAVEHLKTFPA